MLEWTNDPKILNDRDRSREESESQVFQKSTYERLKWLINICMLVEAFDESMLFRIQVLSWTSK